MNANSKIMRLSKNFRPFLFCGRPGIRYDDLPFKRSESAEIASDLSISLWLQFTFSAFTGTASQVTGIQFLVCKRQSTSVALVSPRFVALSTQVKFVRSEWQHQRRVRKQNRKSPRRLWRAGVFFLVRSLELLHNSCSNIVRSFSRSVCVSSPLAGLLCVFESRCLAFHVFSASSGCWTSIDIKRNWDATVQMHRARAAVFAEKANTLFVLPESHHFGRHGRARCIPFSLDFHAICSASPEASAEPKDTLSDSTDKTAARKSEHTTRGCTITRLPEIRDVVPQRVGLGTFSVRCF